MGEEDGNKKTGASNPPRCQPQAGRHPGRHRLRCRGRTSASAPSPALSLRIKLDENLPGAYAAKIEEPSPSQGRVSHSERNDRSALS